MIKYLHKLDPKVCASCKIDLFAYPNKTHLVCGKCGQQYEIRTGKENK